MKITTEWKNVFINYIKNNFREYTLVFLIFVIGIFVGVMVVNNCDDSKLQDMSTYISDFITKFKNAEGFDKAELITSSIKNNIILALILWLAGTTVVGMPIVLIVIFIRGLSLGYTISIITYTLGAMKGISFCIISMAMQDIFYIPALLTLGVSSIKLYRSIIKDKRKENIKLEIVRHTIISGLMIFVLIISSLVENMFSMVILKKMIKYF